MEKSHWRLQPLNWSNQPSGKIWANHYIQVANRTLWPASAPEANWHHGLCTLRLQRNGTDGPPHPPGLSHPAETETPVMAAGWVNHQQAVGNGGRPAPHHTIPGNMWTEGLSTADQPQKKKWYELSGHSWNLSLGLHLSEADTLPLKNWGGLPHIDQPENWRSSDEVLLLIWINQRTEGHRWRSSY